MYSDTFYNFIQNWGIGWYLLSLIYAAWFYTFSVGMCWITGGIAHIRISKERLKSLLVKKQFRNLIRSTTRQFLKGGRNRCYLFIKDPIAKYWPLTVLAIPVLLYGTTHSIIRDTLEKSMQGGIDITKYRLPIFSSCSEDIQFIIWGIAIITNIPTFFRYRLPRSKPTFFSESIIFNSLNLIFFNIPLGYVIISLITMWCDFCASIYRLLLDNNVIYAYLNTDMMYGLRPTYDAVLGLSIGLIILSLLPTILIIRERKEKYSWTYYLGVYGGIFIILTFAIILISQFDTRLGLIKQNALLGALPADFRIESLTEDKIPLAISNMLYYQILLNLPGNFPFPFWFEYVFGARGLIFIFELFRIISPKALMNPLVSIIKDIIKGGT